MGALFTARVAKLRFGQDVRANVGGVLFVLGGVVTFVGMLTPHGEEANTQALLLLAAVLVIMGVILLALPTRLVTGAPPYFVGASVIAASVGVYFNGERLGGEPMFNELFYFWPALFVGYFMGRRGAVLTIAAIAVLYGANLSQLPVDQQALAPRFAITLTSLIGVTVAMRFLRKHVDRLLARLKELARTDVLTGLLNRRAFDERLAEELDRARRTDEPFTLVLGDIDHFKAINDRHGHAAGDAALSRIADLLTEHSRSIDAVARVGGEEFALILPGTDLERGVGAAERLRYALKRTSNHEPLTMSFGVVEAPRHGRLPDDLLRKADRALYAAKAKGRDRTVTPGDVTAAAAAG
jgi:diguanylate cyclase (GGDEF)-like protein